ncbi:gluconokinase [Variovorax sp. YR216]|uniref:gluconokinase n=1 Tax=Variovorax sp. YR216 TaxID=1882828 RepID=UPI000899342D|nr:gluconokinase [Variovorax sp. YR216]SEB08954.1 gluconate kinase, SKI family [Variovorax sp. YR216]
MPHKLLVMGVAGCGKSTVAAALAHALNGLLIEGDDHHLPESQDKMRRGIALNDNDREPWLAKLGALLAAAPDHAVLTCSALKRDYRDRLRRTEPSLKIVYLEISREASKARVAARPGHLFPASLVDNQFLVLEPPTGEPGVFLSSAMAPVHAQCDAVLRWLEESEITTGTTGDTFAAHPQAV